jgi:hypothetical protein
MSLQEKMFSEVEMWLASGISKLDFLAGKEYGVAKFNYWLAKWKASQANETAGGFMEIGLREVKLGKVLEIESPPTSLTIIYHKFIHRLNYLPTFPYVK